MFKSWTKSVHKLIPKKCKCRVISASECIKENQSCAPGEVLYDLTYIYKNFEFINFDFLKYLKYGYVGMMFYFHFHFFYILDYLFYRFYIFIVTIYDPRHDKTNIVRLRPAWIQTSLRIRAVWSGSMLFAYKPYNK
jgi:hypothetical protein